MRGRSKRSTGIRATRLRACLPVLLVCAAFILQLSANPAVAGMLQASDYLMAGDAARTRVVIRFDQEPQVNWLLLRDPHRLVIDLPETSFHFEESQLEPRGMVTQVLHGNLETGSSRIIVALDGPFAVERMDVLANEKEPGYRLVADLVASSETAFETALIEQIGTTASTRSTPKSDRVAKTEYPPDDRFVIVVDAGHGGIDTGAKGVTGTQEKTITLAFALELRSKLAENGRYDIYLTRDRDVFLRLDERVRAARQHDADLFISVHADAIRHKFVRGATVYTVSDKASDPEAAAKAIRENLADKIAGIKIEQETEQVADILADLIRRETHSFSIRFARSLVGELSDSIEMIETNPHRFAGFRVLKAPDVPSVLLELGYLSNVKDEALMRDPDWRAKAMDSIVEAIDAFAAAKAGPGG
jgi:N-acetylmuramoyl-L-alanine amidase